MTGHDDFDRTLADWFEANALSPAPADGLDRVLDATRRRRPRTAWLASPGSHWVGDALDAELRFGARSLARLGLRWSTALILLLAIAALVAGAILVAARLVQPSPLPVGSLGHLAYGLLDGDIYVADWDGRSAVRITDSAPTRAAGCPGFWAEGPMWSPDGRLLAYRSRNDCDAWPGTVYLSDPAGHVVASFPGEGWRVPWSPDSTRVATWVELGKTIGIYDLNGVRQALLTLPDGHSPEGDFDPVWSPDGASLLIRLGPDSPSAVWELPIDGGTPRRVPDSDPRSDIDAVYSADGTRVAFASYGFSLKIAKADGTQRRILVGAENGPTGPEYGPSGPGSGAHFFNPVWSPTGDRIAFVWCLGCFNFDPAGDPEPSTSELRLVDVASGAVTSLASLTDSPHVIKFSPDGGRILFSITDASDATSLWSVRANGSGAQVLVTGIHKGWGDFDWQPLPAGP